MTPPTFVDPALDADLGEQGFAITPFLSSDEVADLRRAYRAIVPPGDHGLTVDYMRPDRSVMRELAALLAPVWERHFPAVFADHEPVFATFVTKHPGEASNMFLHEDRSFVDERRFRAGTLWIPLVDVGPHLPNGGLELIPHSHHLASAWSGTGTPELYRPYEPYLRRHLRGVAVPAGSAVFYDTRTLHASPANLSSEPRETVVCAVAPRGAEWIHVVATSHRHRRIHRVDPDFYLDVHPHTVDELLAERYPVVEELDDEIRLDAAAVLDVLPRPPGTEGTDEYQLLYGLDDLDGVARSPRRLPLCTLDLSIAGSDLEQLPSVVGSAPFPSATFQGDRAWPVPVAGVLPDALRSWLDAWGGAGAIGALAADDARDGAPADPPAAAALIIIEPGGAGTLLAAAGTSGHVHVDTVDAATAGAVLDIDGTAEPLDEDRSLRIDARRLSGAGITFRHRGPGLAVLLVTAAVAEAHTEVPPPADDRVATLDPERDGRGVAAAVRSTARPLARGLARQIGRLRTRP